jgi:hypothetical protein
MNINELFNIIQERLQSDDLAEQYVLNGNCIIWSYDLNLDSQEVEESFEQDDDDDNYFSFEAIGSEELLIEKYDKGLEKLESLLDELGETDKWMFSESETNENIISFKIF